MSVPLLAAASQRLRGKPGRPRKPKPDTDPPVIAAQIPRLVDLAAAAAYISCSPWTVRDLDAAGVLPRVRIPLPGGGELRKVLYDMQDLDRLIETWKVAAQTATPRRPA